MTELPIYSFALLALDQWDALPRTCGVSLEDMGKGTTKHNHVHMCWDVLYVTVSRDVTAHFQVMVPVFIS